MMAAISPALASEVSYCRSPSWGFFCFVFVIVPFSCFLGDLLNFPLLRGCHVSICASSWSHQFPVMASPYSFLLCHWYGHLRPVCVHSYYCIVFEIGLTVFWWAILGNFLGPQTWGLKIPTVHFQHCSGMLDMPACRPTTSPWCALEWGDGAGVLQPSLLVIFLWS